MSLQRFVIDAPASRFTVQAFASGITAGAGHSPTLGIREFDGLAMIEPESPDGASLTMKIRAASLTVEDEMNVAERRELERVMNEQVLRTSRHPYVSFSTVGVQAVKLGEGLFRMDINGKLELNGVVRNQIVTVQVTIGPYSLRATGNFEIKQTDFDIPPANVAGGLMKIKDELKFAFFIVARTEPV